MASMVAAMKRRSNRTQSNDTTDRWTRTKDIIRFTLVAVIRIFFGIGYTYIFVIRRYNIYKPKIIRVRRKRTPALAEVLDILLLNLAPNENQNTKKKQR